MSSLSSPSQDDRLSLAIVVSIVLHVVLFVVFVVRVVYFPDGPIVIEDSIRVDIVALPDKKPAELPPVEKAPEPEPIAKPEPKPAPPPPEPVKPAVVKTEPPKPKVNLNQTKQEQQSALKRLEAMQKLEQMMKASNQADHAKPTTASTIVKGNEVNAGNALSGIAKLDHRNYLTSVTNQIRKYWNLPGWMAGANLNAVVRVYIDAQGRVVKKEVELSSGNQVFDERALATIESAGLLPTPPDSLVNVLSVQGIGIRFPE